MLFIVSSTGENIEDYDLQWVAVIGFKRRHLDKGAACGNEVFVS
jgi:hypothetical protein